MATEPEAVEGQTVPADLFVAFIAASPCEKLTSNPGCIGEPDRWRPFARYGDDDMCLPCTARLQQQGRLPVTRLVEEQPIEFLLAAATGARLTRKEAEDAHDKMREGK